MGTAPRKSGNGNRVCQTGDQRQGGRARQPCVAVPPRRARVRVAGRLGPRGRPRPPRAVTRQGRWGHFGDEKDEAVAHAGRRRVALGAGCSQASAFPGELLARRGGSLYLSLSRSVHLSLVRSRIGPHLTTGFFSSSVAKQGGRRRGTASTTTCMRATGHGTGVRHAADATVGRRVLSASNGEKNSPPPSAACRARSVHPSIVASLPQEQAVRVEGMDDR